MIDLTLHAELIEKSVELYMPLVFEPTAPIGPYNELAQEWADRCEREPSVLDAFPVHMLKCKQGDLRSAALLMAYYKATLSLTPMFTAQLALGYHSNLEENCLAKNWARACPPQLAQWLVAPPSLVFESPEVEKAHRTHLEMSANAIFKKIEGGIAGWDDLELQKSWARVLLDGQRPSIWPATNRVNGRRLKHCVTLLGLKSIKEDPCFDRWSACWKMIPEVWATWQAFRVESVEPSLLAPIRPRLRT